MNEREDYLDRLLRGVEEPGSEEAPGAEEDFFSGLGSAFSEEPEDDFLQAFEKSVSNTSDMGLDRDFDMGDIDQIVNNVKNGTLEDLDQFGTLDDGLDLSIDESLQNYAEEDTGFDDIGTGYKDAESDFVVNNLDGEGDTAYQPGEANQELLDMLSGIGEEPPAEELESQEDSFAMEEEAPSEEESLEASLDLETNPEPDQPMQVEDAVEKLAKELEGLGLENDELSILDEEPKEDPQEESKQEETNEEKTGFFQKLGLLLFGEDHEEPEEDPATKEANAAAAKEAKERKKQEKKEKQEQKKKEKEEKKAQKEKEKQAKPKKEKKPKDPNPVPKGKPLPKGPVVLIMLVGVSLVILINLLTSQVGYAISVSQAKEYYEQGDYVAAYGCFEQGKAKAADQELYDKARLTAYVQQQIDSYQVYQKRDMYHEALSALILGVGRYDKNAYEAAATGAAVEYEKMLEKIEKSLKKHYELTLDQARELYDIREKEDYTLKLYEIIEDLGLE